MNNPNYFTTISHGQKSLKLFAVLIVFFGALAQFASFALIQSYVVAAFGAQPEEVSVALQATYVGVLAAMPLQFRMQQYFNMRPYLLSALVVSVVINIGCLTTRDIVIFTILRFLQGIMTVIVAGSMLNILTSLFPPQKAVVVATSIFFSFILASGIIIGIAGAWVVLRADWQAIYYFLIGLQLVSIVVCVFFFNAHSLSRRYPLNQFDWIGSIIFVGWAFSFLYVVVYGPKRYWFHNESILYVSLLGIFLFIAFIYRQLSLKRPLLSLEIFSNKKFIMGIVLLAIFYGAKDSINLIYGYAGGLLGWHTSDIIKLGLWNILGVIISSVFGIFVIIRNKGNVPKLIIGGLLVMLAYHVLVYYLISADLSFNDLIVPVFLQGVASGLLFLPIILLCLGTLPATAGMTGVIVCAYVRFVATINGIAGYYNLQLNYNVTYKDSFLSHLTATDFELSQRIAAYRSLLLSKGFYGEQNQALANALVGKTIAIQSQLLAIKETFFFLATVLVLTTILLILFVLVSKRKNETKSELPTDENQ